MKADLLLERLLGRAKINKFGHFYIFSGSPTDEAQQKSWVENLIRRYWNEIEQRKNLPQSILSDADLLWISPPLNDKEEVVDYKVEGLEALLSKFLPYRGLQSQRRFIVIEEAHRLTPIISNKLLKTLEEPEGELSFIWLNPYGKKFLPTIESRALNLTLSWPVKAKRLGVYLESFKERFEKNDCALSQFLEEGKKGVFNPSTLLEEMLTYEQFDSGPGAYQQELLTTVKEWNEAERFNQPLATRLQGLHYLLSQRFRSGR